MVREKEDPTLHTYILCTHALYEETVAASFAAAIAAWCWPRHQS
jgi:hypothetical protein